MNKRYSWMIGLLLSTIIEAENHAPTTRALAKYRECYCVMQEANPGGELSCLLAGRDAPFKTAESKAAWAQRPTGILRQTPVTTTAECRLWCDKHFSQVRSQSCVPEKLIYLPQGVSLATRTQLHMQECQAKGIEIPPAPFGSGWQALSDGYGNTRLKEEELWIKDNDGYLWKWESASKQTQCIGLRRWQKRLPEKEATGIICWTKNDKGECPTCFFDNPVVAPSADGKKVGSSLDQYHHLKNFETEPANLCTNCHINKNHPLLFSPSIKRFIPKAPDCRSFSVVGLEMVDSHVQLEKHRDELNSCATCHRGWDKEFSYSHPYGRTVLKRALSIDHKGKSYMPPDDRSQHDAALFFLRRLILESETRERGKPF